MKELDWRVLPYKIISGIFLGSLTRYLCEHIEITDPMYLVTLGAVMMAILWLWCMLIDNHFEYKMITKKQLELYKKSIKEFDDEN